MQVKDIHKLDKMSSALTKAVAPKDDQENFKEDQVFAKNHFLYLVVGRKRSGKSTLALNLLDTPERLGGFKKKFDKIYLISPTAQHDPKMTELVDELMPEGQFYGDFNDGIQRELMDKIKEGNAKYKGKKKQPHHLVIYDDVMTMLPSNRQKAQAFNTFITNQRHFKCSAMILAQRLNQLNPLVRSQADVVSYFRQDNPKEDKIFEETFGIPRKTIASCTKEPHSFLTVDFLHDTPQIYNKFDQL
jgi:hypothetical protein